MGVPGRIGCGNGIGRGSLWHILEVLLEAFPSLMYMLVLFWIPHLDMHTLRIVLILL